MADAIVIAIPGLREDKKGRGQQRKRAAAQQELHESPWSTEDAARVRAQLDGILKRLGDDSYRVREKASADLVELGTPALAEASPRVMYNEYGETYEGRPLINLVISSEDNIQNIDIIRSTHLSLLNASAADAAKFCASIVHSFTSRRISFQITPATLPLCRNGASITL